VCGGVGQRFLEFGAIASRRDDFVAESEELVMVRH
jgi:hypothetical protein